MGGYKDGRDGNVRPGDNDYNAFHQGQADRARDQALYDSLMPSSPGLQPTQPTPIPIAPGPPTAFDMGCLWVFGVGSLMFGVLGVAGGFGGLESLNSFLGGVFIFCRAADLGGRGVGPTAAHFPGVKRKARFDGRG